MPKTTRKGVAGKRIFSVDIDSSSTRLCTSGEDCKTKIWNFVTLLDPATEKTGAQAPGRLLASLSDHTGPVNTARFSPCGHKLASGSDDKFVVMYTLKPGPGTAVFGALSRQCPDFQLKPQNLVPACPACHACLVA